LRRGRKTQKNGKENAPRSKATDEATKMNWRRLAFYVLLVNFIVILVLAAIALQALIEVGQGFSWTSLFIIWAVVTDLCLVAIAYWVARDGERIDDMTTAISKLERPPATPPERVGVENEGLDPRLVEKLSKKFIYPEKALKGLVEMKMSQGKTREQAVKEIEQEYG